MTILLTLPITCKSFTGLCFSALSFLVEFKMYVTHLKTGRYLMNPRMEVARCFGVEYNAEELSEAILKAMRSTLT